MKIAEFHSINPTDPDVYHDESTCGPGQQIPSYNKRPGTGGYRKCKDCIRISG
ncbi:hypothetical protein [Demequina capsici]|uniref:Uncharacterized protein n=1 Tax=Demequina capsici TaxID=3075620 RepID=A0AA96J9L5_9MICO|nr:hypothetical protein [Demequina sp. OYTSA14]WNM23626.1 hypothetical protein RN606_09655 [Demequina sp. OYTSA14]